MPHSPDWVISQSQRSFSFRELAHLCQWRELAGAAGEGTPRGCERGAPQNPRLPAHTLARQSRGYNPTFGWTER